MSTYTTICAKCGMVFRASRVNEVFCGRCTASEDRDESVDWRSWAATQQALDREAAK